MFEEAGELCQDISVFRRLSFATNYLNKETPNYWDFVKAFGFMSLEEKPDSKQAKPSIFEQQCYGSGLQQMHQLEGFQGHPLGIVLLSANNTC